MQLTINGNKNHNVRWRDHLGLGINRGVIKIFAIKTAITPKITSASLFFLLVVTTCITRNRPPSILLTISFQPSFILTLSPFMVPSSLHDRTRDTDFGTSGVYIPTYGNKYRLGTSIYRLNHIKNDPQPTLI